jgi:nitrate/nitrite-specific signal transduction histidine kinase
MQSFVLMETEQGDVMKTKTRRQQYSIVDRSLQYRVLAIVLTYSIVIVLFLAVSLFVPDILVMLNKDMSLSMHAAAAERILTLHSRVWPAIIAMVCVLGIHSVRIFHRLIGPLYRFRWTFRQLSKGDFNFRLELRKSDYLHREKEALNQMITVLAEKYQSMQQAGSRALESLEALEQANKKTDGSQDADEQLLHKHHQHLRDLVEQLQYFHLSSEEKVEQQSE